MSLIRLQETARNPPLQLWERQTHIYTPFLSNTLPFKHIHICKGKNINLQNLKSYPRYVLESWTAVDISQIFHIVFLLLLTSNLLLNRWWAAWMLTPAGTALPSVFRSLDRRWFRTWHLWCESCSSSSTSPPTTNPPESSSTGMVCLRDSSDRWGSPAPPLFP